MMFLNNPAQKQDAGHNLIVSVELNKVSFLVIQSQEILRHIPYFSRLSVLNKTSNIIQGILSLLGACKWTSSTSI